MAKQKEKRIYKTKVTGSGDKLVILESPNKVGAVSKYLGSGWKVVASVGHCVVIPEKKQVDKNTWEVEYEVDAGKKEVVKTIRAAVKTSTEVYLATDPDREGEAIASQLKDVVQSANKKAKFYRIVFNTITKKAILDAIKNRHDIDMDMVNAQQARAILDRVIGFAVPHVLQTQIQAMKGLYHSAGRVQSVALRLLAERQKEINNFKPDEYWNLDIDALINSSSLIMELATYKGKPIKISSSKEAQKIEDYIIKNKAKAKLVGVKEALKTSYPKAPFTTSTLQQAASTKLGYGVKKTMDTAQKLFERGLISYHRSDSVRLEPEQAKLAMEVIEKDFGKQYVSKKIINYKKQGKKGVQDAHTAIQPADPSIKTSGMGSNEEKLYVLIRNRFLACQAASHTYKTKTATVKLNDYVFRASGSSVVFDGFTKIIGKKKDKDVQVIPDFPKTATTNIVSVLKEQKFTKPPAYFNEASLVKTLEANGVGRPSTYAATIETLLYRVYVEKDGKKMVTTERGMQANDYLSDKFDSFFNTKFTSEMEDRLDDIAGGKEFWKDILTEKWQHLVKIFDTIIPTASKQLDEGKSMYQICCYGSSTAVDTGNKCPECNTAISKKTGKFGIYYTCETKGCKAKFDKVTGEILEAQEAEDTGNLCHICNTPVLERSGKYGVYYKCSTQGCKAKFNKETGEPLVFEVVGQCEKCGKDVVKRSGARGDFYTCSGFPKCRTIYELNANKTISVIEKKDPKKKK